MIVLTSHQSLLVRETACANDLQHSWVSVVYENAVCSYHAWVKQVFWEVIVACHYSELLEENRIDLFSEIHDHLV